MKISKRGIYYGQKDREIKTADFVFSEYDYLETETPWHFHENPYFMYVLHGNMYDINKRQKTICPAGSLLLHNWQEPHLNSKESHTARGFHIEFSTTWFKEKQLNADLWEGSQLLKNPKLYHLLALLYHEFRCNDASTILASEVLLLQLCENIEKEQRSNLKAKPKWVDDLKELLHDQTEGHTLSGLSKILNVHPVHLSRSIPKYFAATLGEYIRQQKTKKSLAYLMGTKNSLAEVTYLAGFADQSHFIRCFKNYMGMTPGQFRAKIGLG